MKTSVCMFGALLAIALVPTAVAHADAADDKFINTLAAQGITGDRDQMIASAHTVCDDASRMATTLPGYTRLSAFPDVMNSLQLPLNQVAFFINAAEMAYCPQYLGL